MGFVAKISSQTAGYELSSVTQDYWATDLEKKIKWQLLQPKKRTFASFLHYYCYLLIRTINVTSRNIPWPSVQLNQQSMSQELRLLIWIIIYLIHCTIIFSKICRAHHIFLLRTSWTLFHRARHSHRKDELGLAFFCATGGRPWYRSCSARLSHHNSKHTL